MYTLRIERLHLVCVAQRQTAVRVLSRRAMCAHKIVENVMDKIERCGWCVWQKLTHDRRTPTRHAFSQCKDSFLIQFSITSQAFLTLGSVQRFAAEHRFNCCGSCMHCVLNEIRMSHGMLGGEHQLLFICWIYLVISTNRNGWILCAIKLTRIYKF